MMIKRTLDKLRALRLSGMVEAYGQQTENPDFAAISFEERLGLLVDQHWTRRENKVFLVVSLQINARICRPGWRYVIRGTICRATAYP
jgi:uncharacterized protein with PIN domain